MSKKVFIKVIAVLIVVMLAAMCFTSCKLFSENEERVYNEALYTVTGVDGVQLNVTRSEVLTMYSQYANYYVQYGGYTLEEVMDMIIESKIKSKYLVTVGMSYLTDAEKTSTARVAALCDGDTSKDDHTNDPARALTKAEYYAAILAINEELEESLESYIEEAIQDEYKSAVDDLEDTEVYGIEFAEETLEYFEERNYTFNVDQSIDKSKVKFVVIYDAKDENGDNKKSDPVVVPDSMYTTEFDSDEAAEDSEMVISFTETIIDEDGEEEEEAHTATINYDVVEPRATREVTEDTDVDEIELANGIKVNRYATEIPADAVVERMDPSAKYEEIKTTGDAKTVDAYRQLVNSLESNKTSMDRLYASQFETAVISALQTEVKKTAVKATEEDIINQFKYLYNKSKAEYEMVDDQTAAQEKFGDNVEDGLSDVYYYPAINNIDGYYYVYQILFNFSDEQETWLKSQVPSGDSEEDLARANELYENVLPYMTTKESNPNYDADYDCPEHELGTGECTYTGEGTCPSCAYTTGKDVSVVDVMKELETALNNATTDEEKLEVFLQYVYKYNDDTGIMNKDCGYVIAPEGNEDPNSFYAAFTGLARDVYAYSDTVGNAMVSDGNGGCKLGYAFTPYGVHVIVISMTPFAGCDSTKELNLADDDAIKAYLNRTISVDGDTLYKTIQDGINDDNESKVYSDFTSAEIENITVDMEEEEFSKNIKVHKSAVKDLYEEYVGDSDED